ncbi:MAG: hypothetical protein QW491_03585 [Thermoproteota archaeon]
MRLESALTFSFRRKDDSASYIKKPVKIYSNAQNAADAERV